MNKNNRLIYKKFFQYSLILLMALFFTLALINIHLDKYGIFKSDYSKQKLWPNERFVKMKYILKNPNKYDSFIFGSSRSNLLNSKLIKTGHYYNFSCYVATVYEDLRYLKILIKKGHKIKNIILCLDNDSFKYDDYPYSPFTEKDQAYYLYYPVNFPQKLRFYSKYIFLNPFSKNDERVPFYDFNNKSLFDSGTIGQLMDLKTFKRSTKKINKIYTKPFEYNPVNLRLIKEFSNICKENNIKLTIIILPEYYKSYEKNGLAGYNDYKQKLSIIAPYYDFSGVNEMTINDFNFYDYAHFDYNVGCAILDRIFNEDKLSAPEIKGFGDYVTKDNFKEHINALCSMTPEIKNCIPK